MRMHILSGGRLRMRRSIYHPGAPREEMIELPVSCALLRHPQGNVLFDTGCSPDAATDAEARWGGVARAMTPIFQPEQSVLHQLPRLGLAPDDIDLVICSHLHPDHCGCNEHFRRATLTCHAAELAAAKAEGAVGQGFLPREWDQPQGYTTFDGQHDVFGDGRIVLIPMPGHTPGTTAALVALEKAGRFLLASDAAPLEANLTEGHAPRNSWDAGQAAAALAEIRRIRAGGAAVILGHDDAQWRSLRTGEAFYE
ncbi:N-acyl homoserine lactonase family protein [Plastoroseomonas hellenica]|uniref:N-acyl homoserine lactonase family protein n=1 Tax=Plastoroseomonas hellenica TaxID=2687306 RepID=UPI001BACCFDE|nr:N-acyl homoserine lactonase family protein [Plastoroseomonas hellenica]MBR0646700.1 N-acyl homoserine lactonase family protein [Plastoroseomonas hellenica]